MEAMQQLRRTVILCDEHDIEVQTHLISTKQNYLADMLSHAQYTKVADKYPFIQIAKRTFKTF